MVRRRSRFTISRSITVILVSIALAWWIVDAFGRNAHVTPLFTVEPAKQLPSIQLSIADFQLPISRSPVQPLSSPVSSIRKSELDYRKLFNGRPLRQVRTLSMLVTAYCPGACCCGKSADGITASGKSVHTNAGNLVAADTRLLPFGTLVEVPGYDNNQIVPVLDRGGKIKGNRLDVLMPTHKQAKRWGKQHLTVTIYEYAD